MVGSALPGPDRTYTGRYDRSDVTQGSSRPILSAEFTLSDAQMVPRSFHGNGPQ